MSRGRGSLSWRVSIQGGVSVQGRVYVQGGVSVQGEGVSVQGEGVSVQGERGLCQGRSLSWGLSVQRGSLSGNPSQYGNVRVVRILLECIRVILRIAQYM